LIRGVGLASLRANARLGVAVWWGPVVLAAYLSWQLWFLTALTWAGLVVLGALALLALRRRVSPTQLMAIQVLVAALIADVRSWGAPLRDLHLYLGAGANFLAHVTVYTSDPLSRLPGGARPAALPLCTTHAAALWLAVHAAARAH
jgi:hypothetical protein